MFSSLTSSTMESMTPWDRACVSASLIDPYVAAVLRAAYTPVTTFPRGVVVRNVTSNGFIQVARARLHGHTWPILQTALAAVGAWYIAVLCGVERHPAFASIAA